MNAIQTQFSIIKVNGNHFSLSFRVLLPVLSVWFVKFKLSMNLFDHFHTKFCSLISGLRCIIVASFITYLIGLYLGKVTDSENFREILALSENINLSNSSFDNFSTTPFRIPNMIKNSLKRCVINWVRLNFSVLR